MPVLTVSFLENCGEKQVVRKSGKTARVIEIKIKTKMELRVILTFVFINNFAALFKNFFINLSIRPGAAQ